MGVTAILVLIAIAWMRFDDLRPESAEKRSQGARSEVPLFQTGSSASRRGCFSFWRYLVVSVKVAKLAGENRRRIY